MSQQPPTGWGPQQPGQYPPPPPPARKSWIARHKILTGIGAFIVFIVVISIATSGGGNDDSSKQAAASPTVTAKPEAKKDDAAKPKEKKPEAKLKAKPESKQAKKAPKTVVFKVWGTAPAGALGGLDISYGSDSDTRQGTFKAGKFTATLPLDGDAMYYTVTAQLQGSGDINCSVTVDGKTKKGHASGGYNICDAQLSEGIFGSWD